MYDKLIDSTQLDADLTTVADAIRTKGGTTGQLSFPTGFANAISAIQTGGGGAEEEIPDDGNLHIFVNLYEGRLNPALSLAVNGTISIDWGDGSTETATGNSTIMQIVVPHEYADEGKYHIVVAKVGNTTCNIMAKGSKCALIRHPTLSVDSFAHYMNVISKIAIGNGFVTSIGGYAFSCCYSLQNITIPNSVTSISSCAFNYCYSLQNITIPDSVKSIATYAFNYCYSLQNITIPDSVKSITNYTFAYCYSLQNITIPDSVTSIGNYAFSGCYSLQNITIPNSVTSIGTNAFNYCYSLQNITIPDSVTSIGSNAFAYCSSLGIIRFESAIPPVAAASNAFDGLPTDCIIEIPRGSFDAYRVATNYPDPARYVYVEV